MANKNNELTILNTHEPNKPLTDININSSIKLTSTNYLSWEIQMEALLIGYDLYKFIDGSHLVPLAIITMNDVTTPNLEFQTWLCQDKLIFGAFVGFLTLSLIPLISQSQTSCDAW